MNNSPSRYLSPANWESLDVFPDAIRKAGAASTLSLFKPARRKTIANLYYSINLDNCS